MQAVTDQSEREGALVCPDDTTFERCDTWGGDCCNDCRGGAVQAEQVVAVLQQQLSDMQVFLFASLPYDQHQPARTLLLPRRASWRTPYLRTPS